MMDKLCKSELFKELENKNSNISIDHLLCAGIQGDFSLQDKQNVIDGNDHLKFGIISLGKPLSCLIDFGNSFLKVLDFLFLREKLDACPSLET